MRERTPDERPQGRPAARPDRRVDVARAIGNAGMQRAAASPELGRALARTPLGPVLARKPPQRHDESLEELETEPVGEAAVGHGLPPAKPESEPERPPRDRGLRERVMELMEEEDRLRHLRSMQH